MRILPFYSYDGKILFEHPTTISMNYVLDNIDYSKFMKYIPFYLFDDPQFNPLMPPSKYYIETQIYIIEDTVVTQSAVLKKKS